MPVETSTEFLNIDLILTGRFDSKPLLRALGDEVFMLHEDAVVDGKKNCLVLVAAAPSLDLSRTLSRLLKWVEGLPPSARRSWAAASRRAFDIGIQAGRKPHDSHWTIRRDQVVALAKAGGEVAFTVYGAEWKQGMAVSRSSARRSRRR